MAEPVFVSTVAGADEVVRRGKRRRVRSAALSAGCALAVVTVLVLAPWRPPAGSDSLVPAGPGVLPSPSHALPTPLAPAVAAAPQATNRAVPSGPAPAASSTPSRTPISPAARRPPVVRATSPITRGTASIAPDDLCRDDPVDAARGWCVRYTGPDSARRGHPVTLTQELCRLAAYPARAVTFASTREALMSVSGGSAAWQAGQGERYRSPGRTVTVQPGTCLTWSSTWDTRGSDGFLVPPGTYDVSVGVEADDTTSTVGAQLDVTD